MNLRDTRITGILFDFEGTLVDFQWEIEEAVNETLSALAGMGINKDLYGEYPDYASIFNYTVEQEEEKNSVFYEKHAIDKISEIYDRYDTDALSRWNLYPDTLTTLESLKRSGIKTGLVTNVGRQALDTAVTKLKLGPYLDFSVSRNDVVKIKPHTEGLVKAIELMGTEAEFTLFVGDSKNDIEAGHGAGMPVCYIRGGEKWPEHLPEYTVELVITELSQIIPALRQ